MGTLFSQEERPSGHVSIDDVSSLIEDFKVVSKETGLPISDVIQVFHSLQIARGNRLYVRNGDAHDEQMAGFGLLLRELVDALKER